MKSLNKKLHEIMSRRAIVARFIEDHQGTIKNCIDNDKWYHFDGASWKEEPLCLPQLEKVQATLDEYYNDHLPLIGAKEEPVFYKFFDKMSGEASGKRILKDAKINRQIQIRKKQLDQHHTLLAAPNGTIDLETGELLKADPLDFITLRTETEYHPEQSCPRFLQFIDDITSGSKPLGTYLLDLFGYGLTGLTDEQLIHFFHGNGANGKTLVLEIIRKVVGSDLVVNIEAKTLVKKNGRVIREDIARIDGARIATGSEIDQDEMIDESIVKSITGKERITCRYLHNPSFEFESRAKIISPTNHLPDIKGVDTGISRRIRVVPFNNTFLGENDDKNLLNELTSETEGILSLLVRHAVKYLKTKTLIVPEEVASATKNYLENSSSAKMFKEDCLEKNTNPKKDMTLFDANFAYKEYCSKNCFNTASPHEFSHILKTMGLVQRKSGGTRYWDGWSIKSGQTSGDPQSNTCEGIGEFTLTLDPATLPPFKGTDDKLEGHIGLNLTPNDSLNLSDHLEDSEHTIDTEDRDEQLTAAHPEEIAEMTDN